MRQWLINQRTKPKHVRDNIAFGFAGAVTVVALVGWLVMIPKEDVFQSNVTADKSPEAFSTFFNQIKEQVAGVRESIKEQASSTPAVATSTGFGGNSSQSFGASTTVQQEAAIFVVPAASTTGSSSTPSVAY
jgi:hypothetical protein